MVGNFKKLKFNKVYRIDEYIEKYDYNLTRLDTIYNNKFGDFGKFLLKLGFTKDQIEKHDKIKLYKLAKEAIIDSIVEDHESSFYKNSDYVNIIM